MHGIYAYVMPERAPRILLVDDEQPIQTLLSFPLQRDGYEVVQASDGREALARFGEQTFDLVVLDVMMPKIDGLEVCRRLRARSTVPIIMLTAKSEEIDKVLGLELGADDYITKPFSMREFRSRVKAALRRAGHGARRGGHEQPIEVLGLRIDPAKRAVRCDGEPSDDVRRVEILALASNPGRVYTRDMLLARIWGDSAYRDPRTIDVTSATCARRSRPTPRSRSTSSRCAASAIASGTPSEELRMGTTAVAAQPAHPDLRADRAGAIGIVYFYVTPRLEDELVDQKLERLAGWRRSPTSGPLRALVGTRTSPKARSAGERAGGAERGSSAEVTCSAQRRHLECSCRRRLQAGRRQRCPTWAGSAGARGRIRPPGDDTERTPVGRQALAARPLIRASERPRRGGLRRLARRRRGQRDPDPAADPGRGRHRARARRARGLPRRGRLHSADQAARGGGAEGGRGDFSNPIHADSDDEIGQLAAAFDDMQRQLARLDTARKQFIASASHELRTPIFSLGGFLELLEDEELDEETRAQFLAQLRGQVERHAQARDRAARPLAAGVRRARAAARADRDRPARARGRGRVHAGGRAARAEVEVHTGAEPIEIECDPERVAQVIRILVDNALVHTPAGT